MYHGPAKGAEQYFNSLEYELPKGESTADWLIDISSGRLEPSIKVSTRLIEKQGNILEKKHENSQSEEEIEDAVSGSKERRKEPNDTAQKSDAQNLNLTDPVITVDNCVGKKGVTTGKVVRYVYLEELKRKLILFFSYKLQRTSFLHLPIQCYRGRQNSKSMVVQRVVRLF